MKNELYRLFKAAEPSMSIRGQHAAVRLACARAKLWMRENGVTWDAIDEDEPWDGDAPAPDYLLCVRLWKRCDECGSRIMVGSLGMVGVNSLSDPYLESCAVDLAIDAMSA